MKKNILILSMLTATTIVFMTGCSKDDETAPDITLNGASYIEISLNSPDWVDLGATVTDDEDEDLTTTSDAGPNNPNTDRIGEYTITYTATDAAGNVGIAVRTIRVKNDAEDFAGTYDVHDTVPGIDAFTYTQTIKVDSTVNNRVHFSLFADYANNTNIYATKVAGELEIPLQTAVDIGSGSDPCNIATHKFSSSNFTNITGGFILYYTDEVSAPISCVGSVNGTATYTKQ